MPFELYSYRRVGDLEGLLRGLPFARGRIFLVGGSGDRGLLSEIFSAGPHTSPGYQVRRWDEIYRYFSEVLKVERPRVQIDPPDHWLLLHGIVKRYREAGGVLPPGALRRGFLSLLGSQIRELIREDVRPENLDGLYEEENTLGAAFAALYRAYLAALDENGLSDSAGVTTETRRLLDRQGADEACRALDIVLVGFSSLTHSQLSLVRALVGRGASVRLCAPDGGMKDSYGAAQQFGVEGKGLSSKASFRVVRLEGGDPRQEFETAARSLALWEQGEGALAARAAWPGWDALAFCVPQGRLAEAREVFSRYGLPCRWDFRVRVSDSPLWRLSSACLDAAAGGWQTEPVLRLLSEPWLRGLGLDVEKLRPIHPRGALAWNDALKLTDAAALEDFAACRDYAAKVASGGTALELLDALRKFAGNRAFRAAELAMESPELDASVAMFSGALKELDRKILFIREVVRDLGTYGDEKLSGGDARAYLAAWADGTTVEQMRDEADCMTVFAGAPPALFHVPWWFMIGTESSQWPGGLRESPLLDESRKEKLHESAALSLDRSHLPLLAEKRQQREFLFRRLLACGDVCTVVCRSAEDAEGRPQDETPLIADAERERWIEIDPEKISRTLDGLLALPDEAALTPVEARRPDLSGEGTLPPSRTCPGALDASPNSVCSVYLSSVDDYANCPYRFALARLLCYKEPARSEEYDAMRGGTALHALFERVWRAYAESGFSSGIPELAEARFDEVVGEKYPELLSLPSLRRSLYDMRLRAKNSALRQTELEAVLRPMRTEIRIEERLPPLSVDGVTFSGCCDRLDILRGGKFMLWDYKSGSSDNYKKAFQLACYALALERGDDSPGKCAGWGYIGMKDGGVAGICAPDVKKALGKLVSFPKEGTLDSHIEDAEKLLKNVAESMRTRVFPPNFSSGACRYCSFAGLCRKGELSGEIDDEEEERGDE